MASKKWTPEQAHAIESRGGSLLVSAAAGSGKTAVLVERVVQRLLDQDDPIDADRLLIVTFSNAAAAEMKERIAARIAGMMEQDPQNLWLRRQHMLLGGAHISTIHAFCLDFIRLHFERLSIAPDRAIGDENQLALLRDAAAAEAVEAFYSADEDGGFSELVELLSSGRDDKKLTETIFKLYDFIRSHPFYEQWLDRKLEMYRDPGPVADSVWGKVILRYVEETIQYLQNSLEQALALAREDEAAAKAYAPTLEGDLDLIRRLLGLAQQADWDGLCGALQNPAFGRLGALRGESPVKDAVKGIREQVKSTVGNLAKRQFCATGEEFAGDMADLYPKVKLLFELTKDFARRVEEKKEEQKLLDFSDLEHLTLSILMERQPDGSYGPTALAKEESLRYAEIFIDEYQDTNEVQDMIFRGVSQQEGNLFFVGDVKQSIYRFRQAMPEIFLEKKDRFAPWNGRDFPAKLTLGCNFRSRAEVTDAVNFFFSQLMSRDMGEIDYTSDERLLPRASYPESGDCATEFCILNLEGLPAGDDPAAAEAAFAARRIKTLLESGMTVQGEAGPRPIRPSDICILLRSPKNKAALYVKALQEAGVSAWSEGSGSYLGSREVSLMISLLKTIDDPLADIPMAAVLLSPLGGFTPDQLACLRLRERRQALYLSLLEAKEEKDPAAARFLELLDGFRRDAATLPVGRLLMKIYAETEYPSMVLAGPRGQERRANLLLLAQYAEAYDKGSGGLTGFLRYLTRVQERGSDFPAASVTPGGGETVRIMSIHRSKGLEFPVVLLCDTGKNFNKQDLKDRTILHSQLGFAAMRRNRKLGIQFTTVPMEALRLENDRAMLSEEMRVLYVALTRAREKIIITAALKKPWQTLARLPVETGERLSPAVVRAGGSYAQWMLQSLIRHPDAAALREQAGLALPKILEEEARFQISVEDPAEGSQGAQRQVFAVTAEPDPQQVERLRRQAGFVYPHLAAVSTPSKLGVSAVAEGAARRRFDFSRTPKCLEGKSLTGAQRGQAIHKFMQFSRYEAAEKDLAAEALRLLRQKYLTQAEADSLDLRALERFFASPLYRRMKAAGEVRRELRFLWEAAPGQLGLQGDPEDRITVQGVADCVFQEGGGLVLVDYKSDRVQ
ncbi:MAG: helicase-exonuclease AddAB subunit AddA, partial [Oscillospiraceae bacterium]|nr:helicase-exonuclease AddAB subunit AddA [Oscillospiraceae bacterium]